MKKLIVLFSAAAMAAPAFAYYEIKNATDTPDNAPYITSVADNILWKANEVNGTEERGLKDYYVKVAANTTAAFKKLYASGGGGQFNNMVTLLEEGSTFRLTNQKGNSGDSFIFNETSNVMLIYKFKLADGATSATVDFSNADSGFNMGYSSTATGATTIDRGFEVGEGVNLTTSGLASGKNFVVTNSSVGSKTPFFNLNGNMTLAEGVGMQLNFVKFTQGANSVLVADRILLGALGSAGITEATFNGAVNAATAGANTQIQLAGGSVNLTSNETALAKSGISGGSTDRDSALNIVNYAKVFSYTAGSRTTLNVLDGAKLVIGDGSQNYIFNNGGTATVKGTLEFNLTGGQHGVTNALGNMTVDGGTVVATSGSGSSAYVLAATAGKTVTLKNGAKAKVTTATDFLCISLGGTFDVQDTSKIDTSKIVFYNSNDDSSGTSRAVLKLASGANLTSKANILVNGKGALLTTARLELAKDSYEFGMLEFLRVSNIEIVLNGSSISFTDVRSYSGSRDCDSNLIFTDFENGLVKLGINESILAADGTISLGVANTSLKISGLTKDGKALNDGWSIDSNGYLFNLGAVVPEPAEWAAIFGALALAFAAYRRRK